MTTQDLRALDLAVAEQVMGWRADLPYDSEWALWRGSEGTCPGGRVDEPWWVNDVDRAGDDAMQPGFKPSTDLNAAFLVVHHLIALGYEAFDLQRCWDSGKWRAGIGSWTKFNHGSGRCEAEANTPTEAICRVALQAVSLKK